MLGLCNIVNTFHLARGCEVTSHNPFTNWLIIQLVTTFICPRIEHNREDMPPLYFRAQSFFHVPSDTFVLYSRCTLLNSCYISSVPSASVTLPAIAGVPQFTIGPYQQSMLPTSRQCRSIGIEIHRYCSPAPVRLAMHPHTQARTQQKQHIPCIRAINQTEPVNEWAGLSLPRVRGS